MGEHHLLHVHPFHLPELLHQSGGLAGGADDLEQKQPFRRAVILAGVVEPETGFNLTAISPG